MLDAMDAKLDTAARGGVRMHVGGDVRFCPDLVFAVLRKVDWVGRRSDAARALDEAGALAELLTHRDAQIVRAITVRDG
ncbi:hypothetical protein [Phenylobacterium sp.]|uniref:hypothetical protein n=1 Tax=Phenylobacterium sp. TaxID=1871053 RepID=UPI002E37C27D|nr:hypothetical protein [Phenylobacterium sp.]HEX4713210.1 hypothetical protein [Phenylobacterium sp.]